MAHDLYTYSFFTDPEIIQFRKTFHPPRPVVSYKENLRIYEKTKPYSHNEILFIKTIIRIITEAMRKFMCYSICHESTAEDRRDMYKKALEECKVNKRSIKFKDYRNEKSEKMRTIIVLADGAGIAAGAAGGAVIGGIFGGPIGAAVGAAGGSFVGVVGGSIVGGALIANNFSKWKKKVDSDQFIEKLIEFHQDHDELKDFICLFSGELIIDPVISKYGHTYERSFITHWITEREKVLNAQTKPDWATTDPRRNGRLTVNDLKTDYGCLAKMQGVYSKILTDDIEHNEMPKYVKEGLIAIRKDIDVQIKKGLEIVEKQHFNDFLKDKITLEKFTELEAERTKIKIELKKFIKID